MKTAMIVGFGCLGVACATSQTVTTPTAPTVRPTATASTRARQEHPQDSHGTTEPATTPPPRDHTLALDDLPPAFALLSPRDREQWHACHIFFLGDQRTGVATERYAPTPGTVYRPPASQHLGFTVTPSDYVAVPTAERRAWLVRNGCPDSLVDLADGTHLDMIHP